MSKVNNKSARKTAELCLAGQPGAAVPTRALLAKS